MWENLECSEVCAYDRGQDCPIQTDLAHAQLIRSLLYGDNKSEQFLGYINWHFACERR